MNSSELVKNLNGDKPFEALKLFLGEIVSSSNPKDIIGDLLKVSSSCDDILKLLKIPKLTKAQLAILFDVLGHILMSLADDEFSSSVSHHITRWMLQNCSSLIANLLVPKTPALCLIAVLHCITGMVMTSVRAANDVLTYLNTSRFNFGALARKKDSALKDKTVRTYVFCLVLAFLNTRDHQCLTMVLQNSNLVPAIFHGLASDPSEMVIKLLTQLHEVVVLNQDISKTTKVNVFRENNCKMLLELYFHKQWRHVVTQNSYTEEEKTKVKAALHKLMLTLFSDFKHGIIFREKVNNDKQSNKVDYSNKHVFFIFKSINHVWEFEEGRELISKNITLCPDVAILYKDYVDHIFEQLNPSFSQFSLVKLYLLLIEHSEPWKTVEFMLLRKTADQISIKLPMVKLSLIQSLLEKSSMVHTHSGILLLLALLKKVKETLQKIKGMSKWSDKTKEVLNESFLTGLKSVGGGIQKVTSRWTIFVEEETAEDVPQWYTKEFPSKFSLLADATQILCLYSELLGYEAVRSKINPLQMLKKMQTVPEAEIEKDLVSHQKVVRYIVQLLSIAQQNGNFEAFGFAREESNEDDHVTLNASLFLLLMKVHCDSKFGDESCENVGENNLKALSLSLLNASLARWGLSSYCDTHIEIWLNKIPGNEQEMCFDFLSKVISKSVGNFFSYLDVLITLDVETQGEGVRNIDLVERVNEIDESVEVKDNETIMSKDIIVPFSCLILGAVDVLKSNPEPHLMQYFSSVLVGYIQHLSNPEILAKHILIDENILTVSTRNYFKSWVSEESYNGDMSIPEESDVLSRLNFIFMTKSIPSSSSFCSEIKEKVKDTTEFISICKQVLLYIKLDYKSETNSKSKKKFKLFLIKVLRCIVQIPQTDSEFREFLCVFKYLTEDPFLLDSYNPLNPSTTLDTEMETILTVVMNQYSSLHPNLKPYMDTVITHLESLSTLDDLDVARSLSSYVSSYKQLTYSDIERMTQSLLTLTTFPCPPEHFELITDLLNLLLTYCDAPHQVPNQKLTALLVSSLASIPPKDSSLCDQEKVLLPLLSNVVSSSLSVHVINNLKLEDLKSLMRVRPLNTPVCSALVRAKPSIVPTLASMVDKMKMDLASQAAFVVLLLQTNSACLIPMHSYLCKAKKNIAEWVAGAGEHQSSHAYRHLLEIMLKNKLFEYSEAVSLCQTVYDAILNEKSTSPHHVLSVSPLFVHLSRGVSNNGAYLEGSLFPQPKVQLLSLCLFAVAKLYKKEPHSLFAREVADLILNLVSTTEPSSIRRALYANKVWSSFVKQVLKVGLTAEHSEESNLKLFECLTLLSTVVYSKKKEGVLSPSDLYQMIRTHSQFIPVMLSTSQGEADGDGGGVGGVKEKIVFLQLALVEMCAEDVCEERHVPILLGAYGATKAPCDQAIFKILWLYEVRGAMPTYYPSLWGRAAVTHFAVEKGPGVGAVGGRNPKQFQTLALLDDEKVTETALNFDMNATLEPNCPLPCSCPGERERVYDQRFLLLVFKHLTGTGAQVSVMQAVEKGAIVIGVAALSSHNAEVWALGAAILKNVVLQFKSSGYYNLKLQWMWLVGVLGYGLEGEKKRLPSLIVHFLINASQMLLRPNDQMYRPIMNYLYLKPALPLFKIPELYVMFFSDSVEHNKEHRAFLLNLLVSGIRDNLDYEVCLNSYMPKLILSLITSPTANTRLKILALNVLESIAEVSDGADGLVFDQSLLVELPLALEPSMFCPIIDLPLWIDAVIHVLSALWKTWKKERMSKHFIHSKTSVTQTPALNAEPGAKAKRKVEKTFNGDAKVDSKRVKRRKTSSGEEGRDEQKEGEESSAVTSHLARKEESSFKAKAKSVAGILEFFVCLGRVVPKVVSDGDVDSISKCFDLLSQLFLFSELANQTNMIRTRLINIDFLKQQVNSWIDESVLKQRLRDNYTDDEVLFSEINSSEDWRHKPVRMKISKEKDESQLEEIEKLKRIQNLVHSTNKIFTFLNLTKKH